MERSEHEYARRRNGGALGDRRMGAQPEQGTPTGTKKKLIIHSALRWTGFRFILLSGICVGCCVGGFQHIARCSK